MERPLRARLDSAQTRPPCMTDGETLWLPAGTHTVEATAIQPKIHLLRLNGELKTARARGALTEFSYESSGRAIAVVDILPRRIRVDGAEQRPERAGPSAIFLPHGKHLVTMAVE